MFIKQAEVSVDLSSITFLLYTIATIICLSFLQQPEINIIRVMRQIVRYDIVTDVDMVCPSSFQLSV